jgi:hypothetical protein
LLNGDDSPAEPDILAARRLERQVEKPVEPPADSIRTTKWKVVPPAMVNDSLGWWVSTKTGWWNGGSSPHHPVHCSDGSDRGSRHGPRTGLNMLRPMIVAPIRTSAATISSSSPLSASSVDPVPELSVPELPSVSSVPMVRELDLFYFSA